MKKLNMVIVVFLVLIMNLTAAPPAPGVFRHNDQSFNGSSERYGNVSGRERDLPENILVLRCEFSDVGFDLDPSYPPGNPDDIPHDTEYFERLVFHLSTYWNDVSYGKYPLSEDNFTIYPEIFTLDNKMGYYGEDELSTERVSEMILELLEKADSVIDYSQYDSYIIFHAGAGQESDTSGLNTDDIWTTFVTRKTLQEGLDPDNDAFPGLEFDGIFLKEFVIAPETEKQPDIKETDPVFGMLGVLCHEFGRQMGLPTLYDNQSGNGKSAGIGNYGVMGTGLWNAAGFVPPLPVAWSRIYMGWEEENLVVIDQYTNVNESLEDLPIRGSLLSNCSDPTIYQIMINSKEYFLLENRIQNPDNSIFVNSENDTLATFSFAIVENQEYYPEGHAYTGQPYFNFMNNTYAGCEWDFYLPGYGEGDALSQDGSGICIWHVDENVFDEKFIPAEEINIANGDETHKAIDMEEADHNQGMDIYGYYGNRDDTYRRGNNDYFGYLEYMGLPWLPTAESYYGGIQLEIFNISAADSVMSFSVNYGWSLDTDYIGKNQYPGAFLDFGSGVKRLFYPMPDGSISLWEDDIFISSTGLSADTLSQCWSWHPQNRDLLFPAQTQTFARLYAVNGELEIISPDLYNGWEWAAPVVVGETGKMFLAQNSIDEYESRIIIKNSNFEDIDTLAFAGYKITANMMKYNGILIPAKNENGNVIINPDPDNSELNIYPYITENPFEPDRALLLQESGTEKAFIYLFSADSLLIKLSFDETPERELIVSRELILPFVVTSYPSTADINDDGLPELLLGGENSFLVLDMNDELSRPSVETSSPDSLGIMAGVTAIHNGNGWEVAGLMSRNRLCIWDNIANNDFSMHRDYPVAYGTRSRNYPLLHNGYLYLPSDNGKIYRDDSRILPEQELAVEYADLQRTGSIIYEKSINHYETNNIFVEEETYVYPNPYSKIYPTAIVNGMSFTGKIAVRVMLSRQGEVNIKIYDIAGNLVENGSMELLAYNADCYLLDAESLSSGIYFARLESEGSRQIRKFGIEK